MVNVNFFKALSVLVEAGRSDALADFKTVEKIFSKEAPPAEVKEYIERYKTLKNANKIKVIEQKNIDFWGKQDWENFKSFVEELEGTKSKTEERKIVKETGVDLRVENDEWSVYKILNRDACLFFGAGTKWCITQKDTKYYDQYTNKGNDFYFLLSKKLGKDNPWYKIALQVSRSGKKTYWDAVDTSHSSVPAELNIPDFKIDEKEAGTPTEELIASIDDYILASEEYRQNGDNASEYLIDAEISLDHLDNEVEALVDELKELVENWEDELREIADEGFRDSHFYSTNEIASVNIGSGDEELPEEITDELESLSEEDFNEVQSSVEGYLSDDRKYVNIGSDYDSYILTIDEDKLRTRIEEIKHRLSLTRKKPKSGHKLSVLKNALKSIGVDVRLAAVEFLKDEETLKEVALDDASSKVRQAALLKIKDDDFLKSVAEGEKTEYSDKAVALKKITDKEWLKKYVKDRMDKEGDNSPIHEVVHDLDDEAFAKEIFDTGKYQEQALKNISDKKYLQEQFKKLIEKAKGNRDEDYISDDLLSEMIKKSGLDDAELMEVVQLPKGGGYGSRRDTPKKIAIKNIKDQNILKSLVTDPKVDNEFKEEALKKVTDQDLLKSVLKDEKADTDLKKVAIPSIKDQKFLIDWFSPLMEGKSGDAYTYAEEMADAVDDQDFLKKIIENDEISAYNKEGAFKKIKDKKWLQEAMDKDEELKRWSSEHWAKDEAEMGYKVNSTFMKALARVVQAKDDLAVSEPKGVKQKPGQALDDGAKRVLITTVYDAILNRMGRESQLPMFKQAIKKMPAHEIEMEWKAIEDGTISKVIKMMLKGVPEEHGEEFAAIWEGLAKPYFRDYKGNVPKEDLEWAHKEIKNFLDKVEDTQTKQLGGGDKKLLKAALGKIVVAGHGTVTFFSKSKDYQKALKDVAAHQAQDRQENGTNGGWAQVHSFQKGKTFATLEEAEEWVYENVRNYASLALQIKEPEGWLFAADVHY